MVAAFRGGSFPSSAAAACAMTEDNFKRAGDTVNAEARRMLANKDELDNQNNMKDYAKLQFAKLKAWSEHAIPTMLKRNPKQKTALWNGA